VPRHRHGRIHVDTHFGEAAFEDSKLDDAVADRLLGQIGLCDEVASLLQILRSRVSGSEQVFERFAGTDESLDDRLQRLLAGDGEAGEPELLHIDFEIGRTGDRPFGLRSDFEARRL
jgi:hypothetical protein